VTDILSYHELRSLIGPMIKGSNRLSVTVERRILLQSPAVRMLGNKALQWLYAVRHAYDTDLFMYCGSLRLLVNVVISCCT